MYNAFRTYYIVVVLKPSKIHVVFFQKSNYEDIDLVLVVIIFSLLFCTTDISMVFYSIISKLMDGE